MARQARFRKPLETSHGQKGYSPAEVDTILAKIMLKPDVDRKNFVKELNEIAWWACSLENSFAAARTPSERERDFLELAGQARRLLDNLEILWPHVEDAGRALAHDGDRPSGCQRIMVPVRNQETPIFHWRVEQQLQQFREMLPWLLRCADRGAMRAKQEITSSGNRPVSLVDFAVGGFAALFRKSHTEPASAYKRRDNGKACGNLIDFLEACLRPLGCRDTRASILRRVEKAKSEHPPILRNSQD